MQDFGDIDKGRAQQLGAKRLPELGKDIVDLGPGGAKKHPAGQ